LTGTAGKSRIVYQGDGRGFMLEVRRFGGPTSTLVMADWVVTIDRDDPR